MSILVPVAAWPAPPLHEVTFLLSTHLERAAVITGCSTGQLCLWTTDASAEHNLLPRVVLLGHTSPVLWIACCLFEHSDAVVSLCEQGHLGVWDPTDGRCLSSSTTPTLGGARATSAAYLPHRGRVAVGGASPRLLVLSLCAALSASTSGDAVSLLCLTTENSLCGWILTDGAEGRLDATPHHRVKRSIAVLDGRLGRAAGGEAGEDESFAPSPSEQPPLWLPPPLLPCPRFAQLSADGRLLLWLSAAGEIEVLETASSADDSGAEAEGATASLPSKLFRHSCKLEQKHRPAVSTPGRGERVLLRLEACASLSPDGWAAATLLQLRDGLALVAWSSALSPRAIRVPSHSPCLISDAEATPLCDPPPHVPTCVGLAHAWAAAAHEEEVFISAAGDGTLHLLHLQRPLGDEAAPLVPLVPFHTARMAHGWEMVQSKGVSASALLLRQGLPTAMLLGHIDGSISAVSLPGGSETVRGSLISHKARVTSLLGLKAAARCTTFASAAADGSVCLWALSVAPPHAAAPSSLRPLKLFHQHAGSVRALLQPPPEVTCASALNLAHCFLSVGTDGALVLYDAAEPPGEAEEGAARTDAKCLAVLSGHAEPIHELVWRPFERLLFCRCTHAALEDSALYIWQVPSGRLERVLRGADAAAHLLAMRAAPLAQSVPDITSARELRAAAHKRVLEHVCLSLGAASAPLHVMVFNIRRLAALAKQRAAVREEEFQRHEGGTRTSFVHSNELPLGSADDVRGAPVDIAACQAALSYITCWGVDASFDERCREEIGLSPPAAHVSFGVRGHGYHFSFLTPRMQSSQHRWQCSPHLTALHSLAAVALATTLMSCPGYDEVRNICSSLVTYFSVVLPEKLPSFSAPSLSLLARHYVDSSDEVQQAARAMMEGTLMRMRPEIRAQIAAAWSPRVLRVGLPAKAAADLTSPQGVSLLVLAVLASQFGTPLEPHVSNVLVHNLVRLLDHPLVAHRAWAAETLGKGYHIWRSHLADPNRPAAKPSDLEARPPPCATSPSDLIRAIFRLSLAQSEEASDAKLREGGNGMASLRTQSTFEAALMALGAMELRLFCSLMGDFAVQSSGGAAMRLAAVTALVALVRSRGLSLEAELPVVVEAVMKPLDPSVSSMREASLHASTSALRELVKRYPMMAFHQGTQRLAVGTVEGVVLVYDLRTATKWRILQGHEKAVSVLAFSSLGDQLASVSVLDRTLRWWLAGSTGFFSFLGLQSSSQHVTTLDDLPFADQPLTLGLEWKSPTTVKVTCNKQLVGEYSKVG
ncbi:hypothetical protein AB1Y20_007770 [Prymnesium parvum]|uniref:Non-specific serine/threonine protein kinase n=1 Tax=Prymnesium parvum TaxID=97485 RepID=A0AB34IRW0_PRYPA